MGFPSYYEDNQEAAGEPALLVKAGKKAELIPPDPKAEICTVKNTVIIKADGLAINSIEIENYAFDITFMDEEEQLEPQIDLTATTRGKPGSSGRAIHISTFHDIKEACFLLMDLMLAIENQEVIFNVAQYIAEKSK